MKEDQTTEFEDEAESATAEAAALPETSVPGVPVNEHTVKPRRARIGDKTKGTPIVDPIEYKPNKCTPRARPIGDPFNITKIILDGDKHYFDREQHGDENGRRANIGSDSVRDLAMESLRHLNQYSLRFGFRFVNFDTKEGERNIRVVCKKEIDGCYLHIVMEVHPCETIGVFEVTIKTAMCCDQFEIGDGQYLLEIFDEISSEVSKFQHDPRIKKGTFKKIHELS